MKQPLLGLTLTELQAVVKNLGMPGFAAKQIASWLYGKKVASIDEMTNLSLKHRELLKDIYEVGGEAPVDAMRSVDGTVKYLYRVRALCGSCLHSGRGQGYAVCIFSSWLQDELQVLHDR